METKRFKVGKWEIREHDNGVTEFTDHKRALMLTPDMSPQEAEATIEALPVYVLNQYIRLVDNELIKLGMKEVRK